MDESCPYELDGSCQDSWGVEREAARERATHASLLSQALRVTPALLGGSLRVSHALE